MYGKFIVYRMSPGLVREQDKNVSTIPVTFDLVLCPFAYVDNQVKCRKVKNDFLLNFNESEFFV